MADHDLEINLFWVVQISNNINFEVQNTLGGKWKGVYKSCSNTSKVNPDKNVLFKQYYTLFGES